MNGTEELTKSAEKKGHWKRDKREERPELGDQTRQTTAERYLELWGGQGIRGSGAGASNLSCEGSDILIPARTAACAQLCAGEEYHRHKYPNNLRIHPESPTDEAG